MNPRSRAFWETRYREAADAGTSLWGAAPNGWIAEQVERLAPEPGSAIDVGAGEGRNALWLAERGWQVIATDFAVAALATLERRAVELGLPVTTAETDATSWRAPDPVDLAVLCYLQLEPEELAAAIAAAGAALTPGGLLLGIWHDRADIERGLGDRVPRARRARRVCSSI